MADVAADVADEVNSMTLSTSPSRCIKSSGYLPFSNNAHNLTDEYRRACFSQQYNTAVNGILFSGAPDTTHINLLNIYWTMKVDLIAWVPVVQ